MERNRASNYVTTPTAEAMFEGANDLRTIPAGVIKTNVDNLNVTRSFARTKPITEDDIGYTNIDKSPFEVNGEYKYNIQDALLNRTTTTFGDIQIFAGVPTEGYSAIEVIPRATTTTPGIVIVGDNLEVDSNGRISAKNSYVHPDTHPASMIEQDATHRFVTDTEKNTWNGKANTSGTYTGLVVGSAGKWTTARNITLAGDCTGKVGIDGSADVTLTVAVTDNSHNHLWSNISDKPTTFPPATHTHGEYLPITGGTINGALTVTGQILSNADVVAYSDIRVKTNIRAIENPIDILNSINGYRYNMLGIDNSCQVGVIAQELVKVLPEAVITDNNGMMAVRYTNIIPVLVEAVKTLNKRLIEAENRLK